MTGTILLASFEVPVFSAGAGASAMMMRCAFRRCRPARALHATRGFASESPRTLYDKVWDDHVIANDEGGASLVFIDRHLVHEVGLTDSSIRTAKLHTDLSGGFFFLTRSRRRKPSKDSVTRAGPCDALTVR